MTRKLWSATLFCVGRSVCDAHRRWVWRFARGIGRFRGAWEIGRLGNTNHHHGSSYTSSGVGVRSIYARLFPETTPQVTFAWSPPVRDRSMPIREGPTARWLASARSSTGWTAGGTHHWGIDVVSGNKRAYVLLTPTPLDVYDEPWW